jgi:hypothetical protein
VSSRGPRETIQLTYLNATYSLGLRPLKRLLNVVHAGRSYLVARIDAETDAERIAIVSDLTPGWLARCCPIIAVELGTNPQQEELQCALDRYLMAG